MEKWIFDSPGQAGECLRQFIKDCYQDNKLVKGELKVGARTIDLKNITMPLLNIYASGDHLVPPSSSKPLNNLVGTTDKVLYEFKGGHIGVFVGSKSQKELAPTIAQWLHERAGGETVRNTPLRPEQPQMKAIKSAKREQSERSRGSSKREQSGAKKEKTQGRRDKKG
jgi:polyhydroxyalkanoate synthase